MSRRRGNDDDARAFEEAMSGARPLSGGPRRVVGPAGGARARRTGPRQPPGPRVAEVAPVTAGGEASSGRTDGVSARELRALRAGDRRPEARLDLHGMTRDEAVGAVERFVQQCRAGGLRAVMIIHGRGLNSETGGPVLRPVVQAWLGGAAGSRAGIMAFAPAPSRWGGGGATLILLRR